MMLPLSDQIAGVDGKGDPQHRPGGVIQTTLLADRYQLTRIGTSGAGGAGSEAAKLPALHQATNPN